MNWIALLIIIVSFFTLLYTFHFFNTVSKDNNAAYAYCLLIHVPVMALFLLLFALNKAELSDLMFPLWSLSASLFTLYKKNKKPEE
jgi:hypothetical protein